MALKQCPDCGNQVSPKAAACPKCGREIKYWTPGRILIGILMVVFVFGIPSYCLRITVTPTYTTTPIYTYSTPRIQSTPQLSADDLKILEKIKAKAQKDFPDDYSTQKYVIEEQMQAYQYMKSVPASKLKSKVEKQFPLDFSTQKYEYDEQMQSKQELEKTNTTPMPTFSTNTNKSNQMK